ncbi:MAG: hypothetical protein VW437_03385 [Betaproteobacteria bacterium]
MKLSEITDSNTGTTYRLVYVDVEQRKNGHLYMFGIDRGDGYQPYFVDEHFQLAVNNYDAIPIQECQIVDEIFAGGQPVIVVGYTEAELWWLIDLAHRYNAEIPDTAVYLDAKATAQKWARTSRRGELRQLPDLLASRKKRDRPRLKSLVSIARLIGIEMPKDYGYGITSERFRFAIDSIRKRGSFEAATPTAKSKATKAVKHNRYDVDTMAALMSVIADQSTDSFIFKAFDLKQAAA